MGGKHLNGGAICVRLKGAGSCEPVRFGGYQIGDIMRSIVDRYARECAGVLAESWDVWRGDCDICGRVDSFGFCDRCVECAIESVYENEREYGGTSEYVRDVLNVPYGSGRCVRLVEAVAHKAMDYQAEIWENLARLNNRGVAL